MTSKLEKKIRNFGYAEAFDDAMHKRFPDHTFETEFSIFSLNYSTVVDGNPNKKMTKEMAAYGRGLSDGMAAFRSYIS